MFALRPKFVCFMACALLMAVLCLPAQAFTPNPDTAPNRQDQVLSTKSGAARAQRGTLSTGKDPVTGDEITVSTPPAPRSPTQYHYGPGYNSPAIPYAYPDVNLDGQEFFPEKADPTDPVFTYRPDQDQDAYTQPKSGQPQIFKPGVSAPNVYRPSQGILQPSD